jgi:hypothetical protein
MIPTNLRMTSLLAINRNLILRSFFVFLLCIFSSYAIAQDGIPDAPMPPRMVVDYVDMLSKDQQVELDQKLRKFADSTSNEISVVIVPDIGDYDVDDYAKRMQHVGRYRYRSDMALKELFLTLRQTTLSTKKLFRILKMGNTTMELIMLATLLWPLPKERLPTQTITKALLVDFQSGSYCYL